jgi:hypothetical protein
MCEAKDEDRMGVQTNSRVPGMILDAVTRWPHQALASRAAVWDLRSSETRQRKLGSVMAQAITSWLICDGRFRVHAINAVGRRSARIIRIEDVDSGERFHGSARKLQHLFQVLGSSGVGEPLMLSR